MVNIRESIGFGFFKIETGLLTIGAVGTDDVEVSLRIGIGGKRFPLILPLQEFDKFFVIIDTKKVSIGKQCHDTGKPGKKQ